MHLRSRLFALFQRPAETPLLLGTSETSRFATPIALTIDNFYFRYQWTFIFASYTRIFVIRGIREWSAKHNPRSNTRVE